MCQEKNGLSGRNLVSVFDFGFWKSQDFVIFATALDLTCISTAWHIPQFHAKLEDVSTFFWE
jgi:hypothetical protein